MDLQQLEQITKAVTTELQQANRGEASSFPYLRYELPPSNLVKPGDIFQAIIIGGSMFKTALLRRDPEGVTVLTRSEEAQPPFSDAKTFFDYLRPKIVPHIPLISLNFAYPLSPQIREGRLDGILVSGMKEHKFEGMVGNPIGEMIEQAFPAHKVIVANDTVCTLLAGLSVYEADIIACGIVGTGLNFAFFESDHEAINLEAANFTGFPKSEDLPVIDEASARPGTALFEKETAGAYLYQHFNYKLKKHGLTHPPLTSTLELKQTIYSSDPQVAHIARSIMLRSAKLVACQIAGITRFKGRDMYFVMEGSLFWEGDIYRPTVEETLRLLLPSNSPSLVHIADSSIMGAAQLAMS